MELNPDVDLYARESKNLIDQAIERSQKNIYMLERYENGQEEDGVVKDVDAAPNIRWLTIEEFTIANGIKKIEDFIKVTSLYVSAFPGPGLDENPSDI